jgi:hypothetical protein
MTIILQKSDLAAASFANTNSNGAGGVALRTDAGDTVYISAPTAGGNIGHVCVTGGTPGTWKTFGAISN